MKTGTLRIACAALLLLLLGCRSAEILPAGAYIDCIWTVPERVTTEMLVALHCREAGDCPPEIDPPRRWEVSAGILYEWPMVYLELPPWEVLVAQPACQELATHSPRPALWLTPESAQSVEITARHHGEPLTVVVTVHAAD